MNQKSYRQFLDDALRKRVPDAIDLAPRIITQIPKGKGTFMQPKLKLLMLALAVMTVFIVLLANGPAVVRALQNLFGYIPGLGVVASDGSLRVLTEPVSVTKDGVTVTIEKGSVDSQNTILTMAVNGLISTEFNPDCALDESRNPQLRLQDGTNVKLRASSWTGTGSSLYGLRYYFPALPAGSSAATLELPCLHYQPSATDWEFPLRFVPASGAGVLPVSELQDVTAVAQSSVAPYFGMPLGISIALEKAVALEDGYILMGSMTWTHPGVNDMYVEIEQILDANGRQLSFTYIAADRPVSELHSRELRAPWAYQISGREQAWPLTLKMGVSVNDVVRSARPATFTFDAGPDPQLDQVWPLDQDVMVNGYAIHLVRASLVPNPRTEGGQQLILEVKPASQDVLDLSLVDMKSVDGFWPGTGNFLETGNFATSFIYPGGLSSGPHMLAFRDITFSVHGDWQITWQP